MIILSTKEKYIVTSALPYINGVKHLGNLIGSLLPADVYTRYLKLIGKDAIYICGTDDHGTPAEISAIEAGKPVKQYCDEMYKVQRDIYERFGLNFDYFGRTSDIENHDITQEIFLSLYKNGYILEKTSLQLYSVDEDRYLPDRYVRGTCPHCGYEKARGDQCESCTKLLSPIDLINPYSITNPKSKIEKREVKHFYIDLPKLQPKVEKWIESNKHWPLSTKSIARKWLKEGLKPRAITRNLKWGIKVPLDGYDNLVFYVWFDAPIGYISITKHWADSIVKKPELFEQFWKDKNTKLIQFMGVDNVPFHTVTWPASMIGADLGYILATDIKSFHWLTYEHGKFSTSENRGIFTDSALELYPADYWRYYLLLIAPERQRTDFQWKGFQRAVNSDLNNLLGNLLNRLVQFTNKHFDSIIPPAKFGARENELIDAFHTLLDEYRNNLDSIEFQKTIIAIRKFWQEANKYFQEKAPWDTIKTNKEDAGTTLSITAHVLRSLAILQAPIIPFTSEKIFSALGLDKNSVHTKQWEEVENWEILNGHKIPEFSGNLFKKITEKEVRKLEKRYGTAEAKKKTKVKEKKKETKEKKQDKVDKTMIEYDDFAKIELISAKILNAELHPKADKLLVLTIDDGKRKDRTLCAGIREYYKPEELIGKNIIIVDNLKPRKLRGIISEGMLLAVDDENGVHLLQPDKNVNAGLRVR